MRLVRLLALSVAAPPARAMYGRSVERCCFDDTLYVYAGDWVGGEGLAMEQDAAGNWHGLLAAMLRTMTDHMTAQLVFLTADDCLNSMAADSIDSSSTYAPFYCTLASNNETVPVARFVTFWDNLHFEPFENRSVHLTTSFYEPTAAALLPVSYGEATYGIFLFLEPFEPKLWLAICLVTLGVGLLMPGVLRDKLTLQPVVRGGLLAGPSQRLVTSYHAATEMLGGGDLEWTANLSSRLLRVGWLLFVLLTVSAYTAELASFFVSSGRAVNGPQTMTDLRAATVCLPTHSNDDESLAFHRSDYGAGTTLAGVITANMPDEFEGLTDAQKYERYWIMSGDELMSKCSRRVLAGEADAILDERFMLQKWLLRRNAASLEEQRCKYHEFSTGVSLPKANPNQPVSRVKVAVATAAQLAFLG